jgi:predicted nucleic acid-binding protein
VYVNHWEGVLDENALARIREKFVVRQSSVVLSELRRGARTAKARRLVEALKRVTKTEWTPVASDWWRAGMLIREVGDAQHWELRKRQEFQNDTLIALSAARFGAAVITANRADFEFLAKALQFPLILV